MSIFHFLGLHLRPAVQKQKPLLMHPDNSPRTIKKFPQGFHNYKYIGPAVETISLNNIRRPALVARLVHEFHSDHGAVAKEEMTASLQDLHEGGHPQIHVIMHALHDYYGTHIPLDQQEQASSKAPSLKNASHYAATT